MSVASAVMIVVVMRAVAVATVVVVEVVDWRGSGENGSLRVAAGDDEGELEGDEEGEGEGERERPSRMREEPEGIRACL